MMPRNQLLELALNEKYAWLANDTSTAIQGFAFQAIAYESLQNRDSVIAISEKAAALYQKYGYRQESAISIGNAVHDLVLSGQYRKAGRYINYYKAHSGRFDAKGNIIHDYVNFYYTLGLYYMGIGKPDSAEYYLHKELREGKDYQNQINANYGLARLYTKTGKPALAAKYATRTLEIDDSVDVQEMADHLQNIQSLYDYSRNQNIAKQKTAESEYSRTVNYMLGGMIVLLIVSFYLFFKKRAEKVRRIREDDQRRINELASNYRDLQMFRNNEKKQYDLMIKEKEEGMKLQSAEIFDAKNRGQKATEETTLIKTSEIYQRFLTHLSTNVREKLTDEDWADLKEWIKTNFQTLYDVLFIKNALSDKDYKICMLAIIRFSPSDIAALLNCSLQNISVARSRIVEKLTGRHGRAQELDKILKASPQPQ
jgi:tetratricopeptide (TPR) repeat protein